MEASTAEQAAESASQSPAGQARRRAGEARTLADLVPHAVAKFGENPAVRYKRDGEWLDVSYAQLGEIVQEIALGLIELGIEPGERVCILANTRPEWSYADLAATAIGAVVVPIYQTNSPEECHWVIADSGACAIVCEDESQLAKVAAVRERLPQLRTVIVIDPPARRSEWDAAASALEAITLDEVRERGRGSEAAELERRRAAVRPEDPYTFIYTSGTTGPPKGCVLSHGNYAAMMNMIREVGQIEADEVIYLYLPLAHSYALLIQLAVFELGGTLAYFGGDTKQIVPELMEVKPTYLPSVPRVFEKVYALAQGAIQAQGPEEQERAQAAVALGMKVRDLMVAGEPIPHELQEPFEQAEEQLFKNVRAIFGGRVRRATSGAAPIARRDPRVLLGRAGAGARGLRHDRDGDRCDDLDDRGPQVRHRRAPVPGCRAEDRPRRRAPDQRPEHLRRATTTKRTRASARSRTAGCTPAISARSTRTATSRSWGARRTSSSPRAART